MLIQSDAECGKGGMEKREAPIDKFSATTGAHTYDEIAWSAQPISKLVAAGDDGVQAIRHLGSDATGTLQTRSRGTRRPDSLMLTRRSGGSFEARVGGVFKTSTLSRNQCFFLPCGADADLEFPANAQALVLHFSANTLSRYCTSSEIRPIEPVLGLCDDRLTSILPIIERELEAPSFGSDLLLDGLYRAVAAVLGRPAGQIPASAPDRIFISPVRLNRVIDFIEANLGEKVSIQQLAAIAGLSMFHFCRMFKAATRQTPHQFLHARRLNLALMLIESGHHSIAEIALRCGFTNQAHFTTAFVRAIGMPPGQYRRTRMHLS